MRILRRLTAHSYYTRTIFPESLKNTVKKIFNSYYFRTMKQHFKFSKKK